MKRIQNDGDAVVVSELVIAPQFCGKNTCRLGIETPDSKQNAFLGVENPNLRLLGGRLTFPGILLKKVAEHRRLVPRRLIKQTIDMDRRVNQYRSGRLLLLRLTGSEHGQQQ